MRHDLREVIKACNLLSNLRHLYSHICTSTYTSSLSSQPSNPSCRHYCNMKISTISTILTCLMASASAQTKYAHFTLEGADGNGNYPNYTLSVPEDNTQNAISKFLSPLKCCYRGILMAEIIRVTNHFLFTDNNMVVYTIIPEEDGYNCDFFGAEGSATTVGPTSDVDPPQPQISVNCFPVE